MRRQSVAAMVMAAASWSAVPGRTAQAAETKPLRILFADVEGGQATLFVTPAGESLLVDTGWPGNNGRDAERIVEVCHRAGISRIDTVVLTHFHTDHAGGLAELAARMPIGRVVDHGENTEPASQDKATAAAWDAYSKLLREHKVQRLTVKVGDVLPISGVRAEVVSSAGKVLTQPLAAGGAGQANAACEGSPLKPLEATENDLSVGLILTFGRLRILDLGDLTWGAERGLVCPVNKLGRMDLYIVSHHGTERSGSPALIAAIRPRVSIMDNGAHKGGEAGTFKTLSTPAAGGGALWQLHVAEGVPANLNTAAERIANLPGSDSGHWIEVDGEPSGTLQVTNGRTGKTMTYSAH